MKLAISRSLSLAVVVALLAVIAVSTQLGEKGPPPKPLDFVRPWPLYRSHRIEREGIVETVAFLHDRGYWCDFDEEATDKYQPRVAYPQRNEIRALLASEGVPSRQHLVRLDKAALPKELKGPYFEWPGEITEKRISRQRWRDNVAARIKEFLTEIKGVEDVSVSFGDINADPEVRFLSEVYVTIVPAKEHANSFNEEGARTQVFLMLDNDIPLENIRIGIEE